jgi:5-methylcytosine-specific restriction endonuclease McrBC regulatory subunit McrC
MKIWTIRESETCAVEGLEIAHLPKAAYDYVTPIIPAHADGRTLGSLKVGPYVGSFGLNNGDVVVIEPRIGKSSFWRMMLVAAGLESVAADRFEDFTKIDAAEFGQANWIELLSRPFARQLRGLEKESLRSGRLTSIETLKTARGRIRPFPTLRNLYLQRDRPLECIVKRRTRVVPENKILAEAARRVLRGGYVQSETDRVTLARWVERFRPLRLTQEDVDSVTLGLARNRYVGPRAYYIAPLLLAKLIVGEAGLSLRDKPAIESEVVLINMRDIFEKYVRGILARELTPKDYVVEKRQDGPSLFTDGTLQLIPDIIISAEGTIKVLLDAKYKITEAIDAADYYQMHSYLQRYDVDDGVLVMPSEHEAEALLKTRRLTDGRRIHELRMPFTGWERAEASLVDGVSLVLAIGS